MTQYGFIGTGSMGSMLIRLLIRSKQVAPANITASSKTGISVRDLAEKTGINAVSSNNAVAEKSDVIFICVKPIGVRGVLQEIQSELNRDVLLISIAGSVNLADLEVWAGGKARCIRVIPSVTTEQNAGISLVVWGRGVQQKDKNLVLNMFNTIGNAVETDENDLDICTNLTSCGPALVAAMMKEFGEAAVRISKIKPELAEYLVKETMMGTARILTNEKMKFNEVIDRVATKGGSTEEGVKVIRSQFPHIMDDVHNVLCAKRKLVAEMVKDGN